MWSKSTVIKALEVEACGCVFSRTHNRHYKNRHINRLSFFASVHRIKFKSLRLEIENAPLGKRIPFLLKLINSRGISLIFSHLCLASAILYVTRHVVNFGLGASQGMRRMRGRRVWHSG